MAEDCNKAFGRYLKTLRERRGLSLDDVCSLSQTFPDKMHKAYLSRCENGHRRLALSKLIALCRIYEVPSDVVVERMELDMELDRLGGPDTEGRTFEELAIAAKLAMSNGDKWNAYGLARDALVVATTSPLRSCYRNGVEQLMIATMNCASAGHGLGKLNFSLHEFEFIRDQNLLGPKFQSLLLHQLSTCQRARGRLELSRQLAEETISVAMQSGSPYALGFAYTNRALLAVEENELQTAINCDLEAFRWFRNADEPLECARTLNNLAELYYKMGRVRSARSALGVAGNFLPADQPIRAAALRKILLGEIDATEKKIELAAKHWTDAAAIAKALNDKPIRFKAEFRLYKQACERGNLAVSRALQRRLLRLSPSLPADTPELVEFRAATQQHSSFK